MSIGFIEAPFRLLYNDFAVIIGLLYIVIPFMVLSISSVLECITLRWNRRRGISVKPRSARSAV